MKKRIFTFILTFIMIFSIVPATSLTASAATKAKTMSSSYCTVKINQSLINKKGRQYATVKLKTHDASGFFSYRAKVKITLCDGRGRYITSWVAKGWDTFKLGDDHSVYRIYVDYYGGDWENRGKSFIWEICSPKKCTIW